MTSNIAAPEGPNSETHASVDRNLSLLLDFFRWLSAFIVVITHSRAIFFVPWSEVKDPDIFATVLYFASAWGDYGVLMFFAISGFLIGGGAYERIKARNFSFTQYFINRFTRIYIVLFPALLLVWLLDATGLQWLNGSGIYTQGYPVGALPIDTRDAIGTANFVSNLLMLQNILTPPFGTAQQLWTLNWEWWSYMLCPLLLGILMRIGPRWALLMVACVAGAWIATGLGYIVLWHLGILLALAPFRYKLIGLASSALVCLLIPIATRATLLPNNLATQMVFILSFITLLTQLRHVTLPLWWRNIPNKWLASFSYSLYLLHITILVFVMACAQTYFGFERQFQPGAANYAKYSVLLLFVYAAAYMFASLTESNTDRLRKFIRKYSARTLGWSVS